MRTQLTPTPYRLRVEASRPHGGTRSERRGRHRAPSAAAPKPPHARLTRPTAGPALPPCRSSAPPQRPPRRHLRGTSGSWSRQPATWHTEGPQPRPAWRLHQQLPLAPPPCPLAQHPHHRCATTPKPPPPPLPLPRARRQPCGPGPSRRPGGTRRSARRRPATTQAHRPIDSSRFGPPKPSAPTEKQCCVCST